MEYFQYQLFIFAKINLDHKLLRSARSKNQVPQKFRNFRISKI